MLMVRWSEGADNLWSSKLLSRGSHSIEVVVWTAGEHCA